MLSLRIDVGPVAGRQDCNASIISHLHVVSSEKPGRITHLGRLIRRSSIDFLSGIHTDIIASTFTDIQLAWSPDLHSLGVEHELAPVSVT